MESVWEPIGRCEFTYRMKVPGGWIVKVTDGNRGVAMCFVPDPRHDWNTGTDTE